MELNIDLERIDQLKQEIDSHGKLTSEILNRINYKFRLDWNYHSNAMEGNSLTQQETRSVMVNNITIEGKPIKDVLEVKGHDEIITEILKIGRGELNLSEKRIKEIHKAIIHEDDPGKSKLVGHWKTVNNHLINYKGEKFDFTPFEEVPDEMHKLLNWVNTQAELIKNKSPKALHPALLSFQFHLKYVSIHPFHDGNGRTARILSNLILISFGFPPIIITVAEKNSYNRFLADIQGYGGNSDLLFEFMCKRLIHSQEIVVKAINGEEIEEPEDLDKKLLLLEKELENVGEDQEIKNHFNANVFLEMYDDWITELLTKAIPVIQKFNKFFTGTKHRIDFNTRFETEFNNEDPAAVLKNFKVLCLNSKSAFIPDSIFNIHVHYGTFKKGGLKTFECNCRFLIHFDTTKYMVAVDDYTNDGKQTLFKFKERLLHQKFSAPEQDILVKKLSDTIYNHIDYHTKKTGIR